MDNDPSAIDLFVSLARKAEQKWTVAEASIDDDAEAIHDIRVAVRRLRSQLRTFRSVIETGDARALDVALRDAGRSIGPARDDLVILRTVNDAVSRLSFDPAKVQIDLAGRAQDSLQRVRAYLGSEEYRVVRSKVASMLADPPGDAATASSRDLILRAGRKRWRAVRRLTKNTAEPASDDQLHSLRIAAKRARYTAEIAAELIPEAQRFADGMAALQTAYGEQHDAAVASAAVATGCPEVSAYLRGEADAMAREWRLRWRSARGKRWRDWMKSN